MNWRRLGAVTALGILAVMASGGLTPGQRGAIEVTDPPADQAIPWINPTTRISYLHTPSANLWLGNPVTYTFGKNATGVTGALNLFATGLACDTTTTACKGLSYADSVLWRALWVNQSNEMSGAAPNCTVQVYRNPNGGGPTLVANLAWNWGAQDTLSFYTGAQDKITIFLKPKAAGPTNANNPIVTMVGQPFRRP